MKKLIKSAIFAASATFATHVVNKAVFNAADVPLKCPFDEHYYGFRHGTVRYIVAGNGKPVLLVHGIGSGSSLNEWEKTIETLANDYKVYAIDLLGFGGSSKEQISYSAYLYVTLINDFINDVIKESVMAVASANSGAYAVMAARFNPANFEKLLLISPTGVGNSSDDYPTFSKLLLKWFMETPVFGTFFYNLISSRLYSAYFLKKHCFGSGYKLTKKVVDLFYYPAHAGGEGSKYAIASFLAGYLNVNIEAKLAELDMPIAVAWGEETLINPISNFQVIEEMDKKIRLYSFEGAKLLPHMEFPSMFVDVCYEFFNQ